MGVYHVAATLGRTVNELQHQLTLREYLGWVQYFQWINGEDSPEDGTDLLEEFGLG